MTESVPEWTLRRDHSPTPESGAAVPNRTDTGEGAFRTATGEPTQSAEDAHSSSKSGSKQDDVSDLPLGTVVESSVGYRRPPVEHQFRKGQSGNRKGRPRGTSRKATLEGQMSDAIEKLLREHISVTSAGRKVQISAIEAVLRQLLASAAKGNMRASKEFLALAERFSKISGNLHVDFESRWLTKRDFERIDNHPQMLARNQDGLQDRIMQKYNEASPEERAEFREHVDKRLRQQIAETIEAGHKLEGWVIDYVNGR